MALSTSTPADVVKAIKDNGVKIVDLRFVDIRGVWQHFSVPAALLTEDSFVEGFGFDGSSIRGFQSIDESDMLVVPDPTTAFLDPFYEEPSLVLNCNVQDPITGEPYSRDSRYVAQKAEAYLKSTGIADISYWGPEAEFFIFDNIRYAQDVNFGYYYIDSVSGTWNTGEDGLPNLGYKPRAKEGYFPVPPNDHYQDIRTEMVLTLESLGIEIEAHHHEVGSGGQAEIDFRYNSLVKMADSLLTYKYVVKQIARAHGKTVTFMPKPLFEENGSGMHVHQSLWKSDTPLFAGEGWAGLSQTAMYYIGGILEHGASLLAFAAPTMNSYHRLVPGYEAPVFLVHSKRNRSAAVRIPMYSNNPKTKRVEFRCPDPAANPYLAFSAMLMAGLDGIERKLEPPAAMDVDYYDLPAAQAKLIKSVPASLDASLDALERDHDYLLKGGVFTQDLLDTYIEYKRLNEVDAVRLRPHPYEFHLYYDI